MFWATSSNTPIVHTQSQFKTLLRMFKMFETYYGMTITIPPNKRKCDWFKVEGDCEDFQFELNKASKFEFCKTQGGKYTTPLVTALIWLMLAHPDMSVTHDGETDDLFNEFFDKDLYKELSGTDPPSANEILWLLLSREQQAKRHIEHENATASYASAP